MTEQDEIMTTLWDHLEDLKRTLLRAFFIVGMGFLALMAFYEPLFQFITLPLQQAYSERRLYYTQSLKTERVTNHNDQPLQYTIPQGASLLSLGQASEITPGTYRLKPGQALDYIVPDERPPLWILSPMEGMLVAFKLCFWGSVLLTSPFWGAVILQFILPGLKQPEKNLLIPLITSSYVALMAGMSLAYYITIPFANAYLANFNAQIGHNIWNLTYYVDYLALLLLGHAVAFELALVLFFLVHFRVLSAETLIAKRRLMIVAAFIIGALLTPPDVFSQAMLAVPLILIYEAVILYAKLRNRKLLNAYVN